MSEVIHRIERPYADGCVEVYGDPGMGWYEWRIVERGEVIHDSAHHGQFGMQYGSPGIALRDALNSDEPPAPATAIPILWLNKPDPVSQNIAQAHRAVDQLRSMATELIDAAADAKRHRQRFDPDRANHRLGMIYSDSRADHAERVAQVLNRAADELLQLASDTAKA